MKTSEEITVEFKARLKALLEEFNAEMCLEDHHTGYYGEDNHIHVTIPSVTDAEGNLTREYCNIDLGAWM